MRLATCTLTNCEGGRERNEMLQSCRGGTCEGERVKRGEIVRIHVEAGVAGYLVTMRGGRHSDEVWCIRKARRGEAGRRGGSPNPAERAEDVRVDLALDFALRKSIPEPERFVAGARDDGLAVGRRSEVEDLRVRGRELARYPSSIDAMPTHPEGVAIQLRDLLHRRVPPDDDLVLSLSGREAVGRDELVRRLAEEHVADLQTNDRYRAEPETR